MALNSTILAGSGRLESAANGGPSVKKGPPADDVDAVQRIQRALRELGFPLNQSFANGQPDGKFGSETEKAVIAFQQQAFPGQWNQFDGRCGKNTLAQMDARLPKDGPIVPGSIAAKTYSSVSTCQAAHQKNSPPHHQHVLRTARTFLKNMPTFIG